MDTSVAAQRVGILVDVQYLYHTARSQRQGRVMYDTMYTGLAAGRPVIRAIAYAIQRPDVDQTGFFDALNRFGFDVRVRESKMRQSETDNRMVPTRTSWEVGITLDAVTLAERVDAVILVTGDGSYTQLVNYLKQAGCHVEVAAFEHSIASELRKSADRFISIPAEWVMEKKEEELPPKSNGAVAAPDNDPEGEMDDGPQPVSNASGFGIFSKNKK